jgi:release factor H-coupled RctB family protein
MIKIFKEKPLIRLVASANSWIEGDALIQLERTAEKEGMIESAGMPDIHPGKGSPVGAAFLSESVFYPHIIGNDAGCGMGFFKTTLKTRKMKKEKWASALLDFDSHDLEDGADLSEEFDLAPGPHDAALGTIGCGNHFAELQMTEDVIDDQAFSSLGCDSNTMFLLIHSGSRSIGEMIYRNHTGRVGADPLHESSEEADDYLAGYRHAVKWAEVNRILIARRFMAYTGGECERVMDVCHNSITPRSIDGRNFWLHRKGRSEERRVGKECRRLCRSRWSPYH